MSDQDPKTLPGQAEGAAATPASAQAQSREAVQPGQEQASQKVEDEQPITRAEFMAAQEELRRAIQGVRDSNKAVKQRMAEIDNAVKTLRASGTEITDEQVMAMKQKAAAEVLIEPEQEPIEQTADPLDASQWDPSDPVTRRIIELQLQYGGEITSAMPQAAKIIRGKGPVAFVKSYEAALQEAFGESASKHKPTAPPAARIPASGNAQPIENFTGREYLKAASRGK